jgi:tetratricopeptide (TPR) repeat protein
MPNKRLVLAGLAWLFALLYVPGVAAEREWVKIQSPHFEVFSPAGEKRARDAIIYFERIRNFFITATNSKLPPERTTIVAFNSAKDFEPYRPNEFSIAFYLGGHERDYIVMGRTSSDARNIAIHEYVHLLVKHSGIEMPVWMNEGLAELYSTLTPVGSKVRVGDVIPERLLYLRQKKFIPLEELTAVGHDSPHYNEKNRAGVFYSQSWALTHMISLSGLYRPGSSQFTREIAIGRSAAEAFQSVYQKTLEEVQKDLKSYVNGSNFMAAIFDIKLEKADEDIQTAPADDLETRLVLVDLLDRGKGDQAHKMYEEMMQAYPQAPSVREGFGYLLMRENQSEEAKKVFAEAVELNSTNAKLYSDYARLLRQDGAPNAQVIPLFERALQLDADLQDVRLYLGYLWMDEQEFTKALVTFGRLKNVKREQALPLFRAQCYAHWRLGNREQAEKALELAKKYAESPSEIESLAKLEQALQWQAKQGEAPAATLELEPEPADRPELTRADPPAAESGTAPRTKVYLPTTFRTAGTLEVFECAGTKAQMKLNVDGKIKAFAISEPSEVIILGTDAGSFEFTCGKQAPRRLTIDYDPKEDPATGTIGEVRTIVLE